MPRPSTDVVSRYVQVRLTVNRHGESALSWAVVVRAVDGRGRRDQMRARGLTPSAPGSAASTDPVEALLAAADAIRSQRDSRAEPVGGPPGGDGGGVRGGQLRLDLPS